MKWSAAFVVLLFTAVSAQAGPPPSQTDTGNCQPGLSCNAFIRLTVNGKQIQRFAGFSITSSNPSATINEATKGSIQKNTASEYRRFARELIEKTQSAISASKCDERVDLIGLAIGEAAMKVTKGCSLTGDKGCAQESMVLSCGKVNAAPPATVPWELVLPSNTTTFDKDGSNFDIFGALLRYAELDTLLVEANDITLLLPTDSGMTKTAHYLGAYRGDLRNEEAVFEAYTAMGKNGLNIRGFQLTSVDIVKYILGYHILRDQQPIKHFNNGVPSSKKTTSFINVLSIGDSTLMDESPVTPNAKIIESDLKVEGGVVVHVLDAAMIPFEDIIEPMSPFECERNYYLNSPPPPRVSSPIPPPPVSPTNPPKIDMSAAVFVTVYQNETMNVIFGRDAVNEEFDRIDRAFSNSREGGACIYTVFDGTELVNPIIVACRGTQKNGAPLTRKDMALAARRYYMAANFVVLGTNGLKSFVVLGVHNMKDLFRHVNNAVMNSPNQGVCIFEVGSNEKALLKPILVECTGKSEDGSPFNTEILEQQAFVYYMNEVRQRPQ